MSICRIGKENTRVCSPPWVVLDPRARSVGCAPAAPGSQEEQAELAWLPVGFGQVRPNRREGRDKTGPYLPAHKAIAWHVCCITLRTALQSRPSASIALNSAQAVSARGPSELGGRLAGR